MIVYVPSPVTEPLVISELFPKEVYNSYERKIVCFTDKNRTLETIKKCVLK